MRCGELLRAWPFLLVGFGTALFQEGAAGQEIPKEPWIERSKASSSARRSADNAMIDTYEEMAGCAR